MKINTKQCTTVAPNAMLKIHPNKHIPDNKHDQHANGRCVKYVPTLLVSPVLVSSRTPDTAPLTSATKSARFCDPDELEALNKRLEGLFVDDDEAQADGAQAEYESVCSDEADADEDDVLYYDEDDDDLIADHVLDKNFYEFDLDEEVKLDSAKGKTMGRCTKTAFSYKRNKEIKVRRSTRLATRNQQV
eukprot:CAMPEP_0198117258 /NCGR_PEP_ID=MMETSP1442-20131203/17486_1 /TAXON_ID= /ORGANISM="Craspedostauros australis, Strain CCMP3328" /LENGTH=188 /DNA_ID=CAMNT_0043775277 /DNA_START=189 /DNA_END=755 /DNA_ORIENTATION=+